jgi:glycosyltransferase involved in cell wall biosynthesis
MGAPAIAGDIPACREVGGEAARYYRTGDAESLAETLDDLLSDPAAVAELAEAAYARGRQFTWQTNAVGVWDCLRRATGQA